MVEKSGMKTWIAAGVALLVAVAIVPALSGAANAASVTPATSANPANQWAYGGQGWSNGTVQLGNTTINWSAMYGWTVVFTVTPTASGVWMIEEQRTIAATVSASATGPVRSIVYHFHTQEADTGFANVTNGSSVYVNGSAVPALGILNASASLQGATEQSVTQTAGSLSRSAYLNITRSGEFAVAFSPSLGLIPLNLTGVNQWNSTATETGAGAWTIAWNWSDQGYNGTVKSGSGSDNGSLNGSATVSVTGYKVGLTHPFTDGKSRVGIVLIFQGPFNGYDGFLLVPRAFDPWGAAAMPYSSLALGTTAVSSEHLYVSPGAFGPSVTAADQTFGSSDSAVSAGPASQPGSTVQGEPMSVAQAQSIAHGLTSTPSSTGSSPAAGGSLLLVGVGIAVIAVVVGAVGVISLRSYNRRRSKGNGPNGNGASMTGGVPPAAAVPPGASSPPAPPSGTGPFQDPNQPR